MIADVKWLDKLKAEIAGASRYAKDREKFHDVEDLVTALNLCLEALEFYCEWPIQVSSSKMYPDHPVKINLAERAETTIKKVRAIRT